MNLASIFAGSSGGPVDLSKEEELYHKVVLKINKDGKEQEREFVITERNVYNFKRGNLKYYQRRIDIASLSKIVVAKEQNGAYTDLLMVVPTEYDYLVRLYDDKKEEMLTVLKMAYNEITAKSLPMTITSVQKIRSMGSLDKKKDSDKRAKGSVKTNPILVPAEEAFAGERPENDQEIEDLYANMLEDLAIPTATRGDMIKTQTIDQKWKIIQAQSNLTNDKKLKARRSTTTPEFWAKKLAAADVEDLKDIAQQLKIVINSSHKVWLQNFIKQKGLETLSLALKKTGVGSKGIKQRLSQTEIINCLRGVMNTGFGMQAGLEHPNILEDIVMCLDFENIEMAINVIELLSVSCWESDEGYDRVMDGMDRYQRFHLEPKRYYNMIEAVKGADNLRFKVKCLQFINTIVNRAPDLEGRAAAREEFASLCMMDAYHDSIGNFKERKSEAEEGKDIVTEDERKTFDLLVAQVTVFEELRADDQKLCLLDDGLDVTNVDDVLDKVLGTAEKLGIGQDVLSVFQQLLLVPDDVSLGGLTYDIIGRFFTQLMKVATNYESLSEWHPNVQLLREYYQKKKDVDLRYAQLADSDKVVEAQRARIFELEKMQATGGPPPTAAGNTSPQRGPGAVPGVTGGAALRDPPPLQGATGAPLRGQPPLPGATGAPLRGPPPLPGARGALRGPPPMPGATGAGGALRGPPPMPGARGARGARPMRGPPPLPGARGARAMRGPPPLPGARGARAMRGPPPLPGARGARPLRGPPPMPGGGGAPRMPPRGGFGRGPAALPSLPAKKKIKPKLKMKGFFWSKMKFNSESEFKDTIWSKIDDENVDLDFGAFEGAFGKQTKKQSSSPKPKKPSKPKKVSLVDPKRQQNCGIALARFRMPYEQIKRAIVDVDTQIINRDRVESLLKLLPTEDEKELVTSYTGDKSMLMETEKFFLVMAPIPRLKFRMQAMLTFFSFELGLNALEKKMEVLHNGVKNVRDSKRLPRVVEVILAIGNYLNGSTARGGAYGFKVDGLKKLVSVKTSDNKRNLLHWMSDQFEAKQSMNDLYDFEKDLSGVGAASQVPFSQIEIDFKKLSNELNIVQREIDNAKGDGADRFRTKLGMFIKGANERVGAFQKNFDQLWIDLKTVVSKWTNIVPKKTGGTEDVAVGFFSIFDEFVKSYCMAKEQNRSMKEKLAKEEARKKAAEARKKKRNDKRASMRAESPSKIDVNKKDLIGDFNKKLGQANASAIVAEFRSRRANSSLTAIHEGSDGKGTRRSSGKFSKTASKRRISRHSGGAQAVQNELAAKLARRSKNVG